MTDDDIKKGISTIAEKLESICPCFSVLDELFGKRQNREPSSVLSLEDDYDGYSNEADDTQDMHDGLDEVVQLDGRGTEEDEEWECESDKVLGYIDFRKLEYARDHLFH